MTTKHARVFGGCLAFAIAAWTCLVGLGPAVGQEQAVPEPKIVLKAGGRTPREPLRWTIPEAGTVRTFTATMDVTTRSPALGGEVTLTADMTVESMLLGPGPQGSTTASYRITDVNAHDDPIATEALAGLVGWTYESDITPEGRILATRTELPEGLDPTLAATLDQTLAQIQGITKPFPSERVGSGARWRVTEEVESSGVRVIQHSDYRLVRRTGDEVEFSMQLEQKAPRGPIDLPGVPPDVEVEVRSWHGSGTGTQVVDLTKPFEPSASSLMVRSRQRIRARAGGQSQTITTEVELTFSIAG